MLGSLREELSNRKSRLFTAACCRHVAIGVEAIGSLEQTCEIIRFIESRADGSLALVAPQSLVSAYESINTILQTTPTFSGRAGYGTATSWTNACRSAISATLTNSDTLPDLLSVLRVFIEAIGLLYPNTAHEPGNTFCRQIREIFRNPFLPGALDRSWLTPNVTKLAQTIYEERHLPSGLFDNARLGILADALEEAGCDNTDILGHLRGGGDHVRGCWVVDLILDKK
jgi:hypothetical protein